MLERIKSDDDFIFGIYENPDSNGHGTGFDDKNYRYVSGICNLDRLSYVLLDEIKEDRRMKKRIGLFLLHLTTEVIQ